MIIGVLFSGTNPVEALSLDDRVTLIEKTVTADKAERKADMALIRAEQKADKAEQKEIRAEQKADMAAMNLENRIFSLTTLGISLIFPFLNFNRLNEMDKKEKESKKRNLKKDLTSILNYLTFKD